MSANPHRHLIRWLSSFVRWNLRITRERRSHQLETSNGTRPAVTAITAALPGTRTAWPGKAVGPLASVYT
ncbi:hypothetical protein A8E99_37250, partial [Burkholderia cenocepacia]